MDYSAFFSKIALRRRGNLIRQITETYLNSNNPDAISFAGGLPNVNTYPYKEMNVIYKDGTSSKLENQDLASALQYGPARGYLPLIKKFREFQSKWHNPKWENWNVMFTCGSQDACSKIYEMFIDEGDPIMVQSPTYTASINTLASLNVDFIEITQDADGIIPEQIIKVCEERLRDGRPLPKLIYINPIGANPTGTVLSESRKKQIYKLAQKYNFLIIEDDAYYFVHFLNKQPMSFFSMDIEGRVIRLDSISKIISAGMRLGCITAHTELLNKLIMHVENSVLQANSLSQVLLFKLFDLWEQDRLNQHFKSIQDFYRTRRNIMLKEIEKHFIGLAEWTEPKGGFFIWLKLIGIDDTSKFIKDKCVSNGIFIIPGNVFNYDVNKPDQHIRLSYSYGTQEEIEKGLSKLAELVRKASKSSMYRC